MMEFLLRVALSIVESLYVILCTIWHHFYNLKNVTNTDGEVLLLVKVADNSLQLTKNNTPSMVLLTFLKFYKSYQIAQNVSN